MNPTDFPEATKTFTKPEGWTDEQCTPLHVHEGMFGTEHILLSRWMPTEQEKKDIADGKPVWLTIFGTGHPPVALFTGNPFPESPL